MAKTVVFTDDMDGTMGAKTIDFSLDGQAYEIDLGDANTKKLFDALAPFIEHAQPVSKSRSGIKTPARGSTRKPATVDREQNKAIREWAEKEGKEISPRGRIPQSIVDEYNEAHKP